MYARTEASGATPAKRRAVVRPRADGPADEQRAVPARLRRALHPDEDRRVERDLLEVRRVVVDDREARPAPGAAHLAVDAEPPGPSRRNQRPGVVRHPGGASRAGDRSPSAAGSGGAPSRSRGGGTSRLPRPRGHVPDGEPAARRACATSARRCPRVVRIPVQKRGAWARTRHRGLAACLGEGGGIASGPTGDGSRRAGRAPHRRRRPRTSGPGRRGSRGSARLAWSCEYLRRPGRKGVHAYRVSGASRFRHGQRCKAVFTLAAQLSEAQRAQRAGAQAPPRACASAHARASEEALRRGPAPAEAPPAWSLRSESPFISDDRPRAPRPWSSSQSTTSSCSCRPRDRFEGLPHGKTSARPPTRCSSEGHGGHEPGGLFGERDLFVGLERDRRRATEDLALARERLARHPVGRGRIDVRIARDAGTQARDGCVALAPRLLENSQAPLRRPRSARPRCDPCRTHRSRQHVRAHGVPHRENRHPRHRLGEERRRAQRDLVREHGAPRSVLRGGQPQSTRQIARVRRELSPELIGKFLYRSSTSSRVFMMDPRVAQYLLDSFHGETETLKRSSTRIARHWSICTALMPSKGTWSHDRIRSFRLSRSAAASAGSSSTCSARTL